jgi:hypothetical protein
VIASGRVTVEVETSVPQKHSLYASKRHGSGFDTDIESLIPISAFLTVNRLVVTGLKLDPTYFPIGSSFTITFSGQSLNNDTYFDVRFRTPDGQMLSALNWQRGITAAHRVPEGAAIGPWTVIGVWAHQDSSDHSSDFAAISATITVTPF